MKTTVAIFAVSGFILSVTYATLGAQAKAASAGVYTADQATQGSAVYTDQCAACHGDNLEGSGPMPPLAGPDFMANWMGKTLGDLFEKTQTTMPATAPGTLTPTQAANVLAFVLKSNQFAAGSTALPETLEGLLPIALDAPAAAAAAAAPEAGAPAAPAAGVPAAGGAAPHMASAGVYAADQVARGETVYKDQCAACHGDNLEGSGPMPPLAGPDFLANWKGKTLGDLFEKTQTTMPATAPGTLTPEQTADLLAYLLKSSNFAAGTMPLQGKMEALLPITIDAPPAQ